MKRLRSGVCIAAVVILLCLTATAQEPPPAQPGEIAPVQSIEFAGNTVIPGNELRDVAGIQTGQPLTAQQLSGAIQRIQAEYTRRGYIADFVYYEIQGEQPPRTLIFRIREVRVSEVRITGLERTNEETVRRFVGIEPGDLYSQIAVRQAVNNLSSLGIFEDIEVLLSEGTEPGTVVLTFVMTEAKTQRIDFGGTYEPTGQLTGYLQYIQANWLGRAQRLGILVGISTPDGRVDGEVNYFNPLLGSPDRTLYARAYSDVNYRFGTDLVTAPDSGRYSERSTGLQAIHTRQISLRRQVSYGLRFENTDVSNFPQDLIESGFPSPEGSILFGSGRYIVNDTVRLLIPASGDYTSYLLQGGYSKPSGDSGSFPIKPQAEWRWYIPLQRITPEMLAAEDPMAIRNLAIRLSAGTSTGTLPFFEQYFVGGINTLRGYRESRFWGRNFAILNTEFRWPLSRTFVGVVFVDVGDAWNSDYQFEPGVDTEFPQHDSFSPRVGGGVGIWWISQAVGIVRLDYGVGEENRVELAVGENF